MAELPTLELTEDMRLVEPTHELEVDLKAIGCPYGLDDLPLMSAWIDGYKAGLHNGGEIAVRAFQEAAAS